MFILKADGCPANSQIKQENRIVILITPQPTWTRYSSIAIVNTGYKLDRKSQCGSFQTVAFNEARPPLEGGKKSGYVGFFYPFTIIVSFANRKIHR